MRTWMLAMVAGAVMAAEAGASGVARTPDCGKPGRVTWRSIGPGPGGAMTAPTFSPHDAKVIVAGVDMGNAFMTRDGGTTWKILGRNGAQPADGSAQAGEPFGNPGYRGMWSCCFDPKRPARIFIGSTHGLYRTTDGGANWRLVRGGTAGDTFGAIAVDPTDPNIVYGANGADARHNMVWSRGDVWKSTDGGDTWRSVTPGGEGERKKHSWVGMVVDRQSAFRPGRGHSRVYLYGHQDFTVSQDAGETWTSLKASVPGERWVSGLVLVPGRAHSILFAAVAAGMVGPDKTEPVGGVYRSEDGGKTWTAKNSGLEKTILRMATKGRGSYSYFLLAGCAARPGVMYLGCYPAGIFRTEDGGATWRGTLKAGTEWVHSQEFDGTDTKWRLNKHGGNLDQNFHGTWGPANGLGCSPTDPDAVAYTDNAAIGVSFDGGKRWTQVGSEFGEAYWPNRFGDRPPMEYTHKLRSRGIQTIVPKDAAFDPFDPKTIAIGHDDIGLRISRDGGEWWEYAYHGFTSIGKNAVSAILYDPAVQGRLWCATGKPGDKPWLGHVCQSDDGGRTFRIIGIPQLEASEKGEMANVGALALDPSSAPTARVLYAGTDKGLYKTLDGGKTWQVLPLGMNLPEGFTASVRHLTLDPTAPNRVYAGINIFKSDRAGRQRFVRDEDIARHSGLYRSEDRGASWKQLAAEQITAVKTLSICKATGALYVVGGQPGKSRGTLWCRYALWRSDDHGDTWRKLDDRRLIAFAAVHPADPERVYMATGASDVTKEEVNVWRSRDGGKTWETVADDIPLVPLGGNTRMVFDPSNPHRFLLLYNSGTYEGMEAP